MGRLRLSALFVAGFLIFGLTACGGGGNGTTVVANPVPTIITLTPGPHTSLELGKTVSFTATPERADTTPITTPVQFVSSNNAVLTIASSGLACAGTWDSLSNPQICTPGQSGVAQITAQAEGVSSPTTIVYVHPHVDKIVITPAPSQPPLIANCISKGQHYIFQATALSLGTDVTADVGPFNWTTANPTMVNLTTIVSGLLSNQVQATTNAPGIATIAASLGSANSIATPVTICPVQSISLTLNGSTNTDLAVPTGTSLSASATVTDTAGNSITGVALTWSSSNAASVGVSGADNTAIISTPLAGGATIIASCTPPNCNTGFLPSRPVYPQNLIHITSGSTGTTSTNTVWVTSDGCANAAGCISTLIPITSSTNATSPPNTVGTALVLKPTPNSIVFPMDATLGSAYIGTDFSQQNTAGLTVLSSANALSSFPSAPGKALAVSPDGNTVIVSDTADTPNQLYLFNTANSASTPFSISGATAAAFSPDSLKAFVVAGSTLYIFSTQDALQIIPLNAPANGVTFLPQGGTAVVSGGTASGITLWDTITGAQIGGGIPTPVLPAFIYALPDNETVLAVDSPGIDLINTNTSIVSTFNFGRGSFTPKQLLVSSDATKAYVVTGNLPVILVFDLTTRTSSAIALAGNALPLSAALTPDGGSLYVGAGDDQVHVINTSIGVDVQQINFIDNFCRDTVGNSLPTPCLPDILAVKR